MKTGLVKKFTAIISAGIVVLSTTMPVFASSQSVGSIDYDSIGTNATVMNLSASQAAYYIGDDMHELRVPVYMRFVNGSDIGAYSWAYISGISRYSVGLNLFGVDTNSPINVNPAFFEGVNTDNLHVLWNTSSGLRIYYDNYRIDSSQGNYREVFLGYMVYQFDTPSSGFTYTFPNPLKQNINVSNQNLRGTAYEYGFAETIMWALEQSATMQDIMDVLYDIDQSTSYLPSILSLMQTDMPQILTALTVIDQHLLQVLNEITQANAQQSAQASAIEDEVNQKASQSAVLSNDMAVNKPSLSANDVNISGLIDSSVNTKFTGFLGTLVQNNFITTMFLIALSCMIIGFVLYGKK